SLGGEMDDLLVDVAEPETLRNAEADVVPACPGRMRNRHDTRLCHFVFPKVAQPVTRHRTLQRAALKDQEPTDVGHDTHAACRVTRSGCSVVQTPPTPPAASRATACAPTRCRSRPSASAPCPLCRRSRASRGRRTASTGGRSPDGPCRQRCALLGSL